MFFSKLHCLEKQNVSINAYHSDCGADHFQDEFRELLTRKTGTEPAYPETMFAWIPVEQGNRAAKIDLQPYQSKLVFVENGEEIGFAKIFTPDCMLALAYGLPRNSLFALPVMRSDIDSKTFKAVVQELISEHLIGLRKQHHPHIRFEKFRKNIADMMN